MKDTTKGAISRINQAFGMPAARSRLLLGFVVCLLGIGVAGRGFAQHDAEAPKGLPETTIAPAGESTAPATADEGAPAPSEAPAAKPAHRKSHRSATHKASSYTGPVQPVAGMLQIKANGWAYGTPSASAAHVAPLHAGKFVNVSGTTAHYLRVTLKTGVVAYVPMTAVELARSADKTFRLTKDTAVLSAPNQHAKKLAEVHSTHDVHIIGTSVGYMKIKMKDGLEGFISMAALE